MYLDNGKFNGVIGGPHATFRALAEQTGGANNLMVHFVDGLQKFNELGAPKLHAPLMSNEDIQFAKEMNKAEILDVTGCLVDVEGFGIISGAYLLLLVYVQLDWFHGKSIFLIQFFFVFITKRGVNVVYFLQADRFFLAISV